MCDETLKLSQLIHYIVTAQALTQPETRDTQPDQFLKVKSILPGNVVKMALLSIYNLYKYTDISFLLLVTN
jgi:hypothetical protein